MTDPRRGRLKNALRRLYVAYARRRFASETRNAEAPVVFAGDSIFADWPDLAERFSRFPIANRGLKGDTASELAARFAEDALSPRPSAVVLLIGTNDLTFGVAPADIAADISKMLALAVTASTPLVLCRIPPREAAGSCTPDMVNALNSEIDALGQRGRGVVLCDTFAPLTESGGKPARDLFRDGLHPSSAGYEHLAAAIGPAVESILRPRRSSIPPGTPQDESK